MQRVNIDIWAVFQHVEDALREAFLPDLFKVATYQIPGRVITGMPVKQDSIAILDPNQNTGSNWTKSCVITRHLVAALRGTAESRSGDHALLMVGGRDEIRKRHTQNVETELGEDQAAASTEDSRRMGRITWKLVRL